MYIINVINAMYTCSIQHEIQYDVSINYLLWKKFIVEQPKITPNNMGHMPGDSFC